MQKIAHSIDTLNDAIGRYASWCAIALVLLQFLVVVLRYVFGVGVIMMQEGVVYLHATLFMLGAAYTLKYDGHVRVDVFYREAKPRTKALVNLFGSTGESHERHGVGLRLFIGGICQITVSCNLTYLCQLSCALI